MGKQWLLYRFTSDGAGAGGCQGTGKTSSTGKSTKVAGKHSRKASNHTPTSSSSSSGCMSAIFHMFDVQHHHFPFHQPSFISDSFVNIPQESNLILPGVEAPRNSLELEEEPVASSSSSTSSKPKQDTNLNLPMAGIQIKTKRSRFLMMDDVSSESSTTSPATKTPNVVARLMGLDLLPENSSPRTSLSSPRPSSSSSYQTPLNPLSKLSSRNHQTTHSLPATPRMSTVDHHHHRFSLQKENGSDYAKEIAKQIRENISRRVGGDITNTMKKQEEVRRDQCLVVLKPKRRSVSPPAVQAVTQTAFLKEKENEPGSFSNSCSPRVRLLEIKNNNFKKPTPNPPLSTPIEPTKPPLASSNIKISSPPLIMEDLEKVEMVKRDESNLKKVKIGSEKYDLRLKKKHQEEVPFVKECKKKEKKKSTPLSNGLVVNVKTRRSSKFISFKKEKEMASSSPSSTTPTLSQKQVPLDSIQQLPRCQSHHQSHITKDDNYPNGNGVPTAVTGGPVAGGNDQYFDYVSRIFTHIGIDKNTPISIAHWYSPSHPLHPSTFHHLEQLLPPTTTTATAGNHLNRKLIFEVVDEVLVEILKPYIGFKPWAGSGWSSRRMYGWELVEMVCRKIWSFPAADCRVLEDIDGLIAGDLRGSTRVVGTTAFEEVAEEIVTEMEREMVEMLVDDTVAAMVRWSDGGHVHGHGGFT